MSPRAASLEAGRTRIAQGIGGGRVRTRTQLTVEVEIGLAGSLNPRRAAMRLLSVLRPELADWAALVLPDARNGALLLHGGEAVGFTGVVSRTAIAGTQLDRLLHTGNPVRVALGDDGDDGDDAALASLLPHPELRGQLADAGPAELLAVGLNARGTTLGALLLARRGGFDDEDTEFATRIAARAAISLDSARLYEERARIATVLTGALRPPSLPDIDNLRLAARYRPAAEHIDIGGDFYDVIGSGRDWLVTIGDVCGKGVEAAALTGRTRQSIRTAAHFDRHPAALLRALNSVLHDEGTDQFVTVLCTRIQVASDGSHADVEMATAGHPAPIVVRSDGRIEQLEIYGTASGMVPDVHYRTAVVRLQPGDSMLMFTDGVEEAHGADGMFGLERLVALLPAYAGAAADVICEAVEQRIIEYVDGRPHDDIALLAVTCGS